MQLLPLQLADNASFLFSLVFCPLGVIFKKKRILQICIPSHSLTGDRCYGSSCSKQPCYIIVRCFRFSGKMGLISLFYVYELVATSQSIVEAALQQHVEH